jgi:glycosyltransferase involved in cell wall biosynthesis
MKIVYLAAGAGGMYCGSCLHDNTLAGALLARGEDVLLVPTYTPLRTDERDVSQRRIFFGGVNVYLQQHLALFRHTPWFLDALFDSPALLRWLASRGASLDAARLGDMTVSILEGRRGRQRKELEKLSRWLEHDVRPDVVHLSNALLVGMAGEIGRRTGAPVVCGLSGEDVFLERIPPPHYQRVRELLREQAAGARAFVAMNRYYAGFMQDYMGLEASRVHVIPHGLDLAGHGSRRPAAPDKATLGFFARVCPDKGLHLLAEAFELLCREPGLPRLELRAAGYLAEADKPYLAGIRSRLAAAGLADRFAYLGEPDRAGKIAFLQSLDVMSVPAVYRESKGLSVLEALANAVPVVLPSHGAYPELVAATGGGLLFEPANADSLAAALRRLVLDRDLADRLGRAGQEAVRRDFHAAAMAERTLHLYRQLHSGPRSLHPASEPLPLPGS